ncbi:thermostable hemolysin [Halioxenophilus sp. WMMB6]|uniref:thermostable hemolysin n=1 Tax=Halioxenophilus sp. WMMB6 TaxID=3073815 RepID=UPI00295EADBB|nr:thermostable hemolysin [Halioxenophilus sp. WMMB6]
MTSTTLALANKPMVRGGHSAPNFQVRIHSHGSDQRDQLEGYIADQFAKVHGARVSNFLPLLLALSEQAGNTAGVVGLKPGYAGQMFLEHYLPKPVEQCVAQALGQPIDRAGMVEIGNLAVARRGSGFVLFVLMNAILEQAGFQWMVFTATSEVQRLISRLGFEPLALAPASIDQLGDESGDWGEYYANNPQVMVGSVAKAKAIFDVSPGLKQLAEPYRPLIAQLASHLRDHRRFCARAEVA